MTKEITAWVCFVCGETGAGHRMPRYFEPPSRWPCASCYMNRRADCDDVRLSLGKRTPEAAKPHRFSISKSV